MDMTKDYTSITNGISQVIEDWETILTGLPEETISQRRNHQNRTIKQLVGHLIDSASNNHQRLVRLQYNKWLEFPDYTQDNDLWIEIQDYQHTDWYDLVQLWKFFNLHIIHLIKVVDKSKLENYWYDYQGNRVTMDDMVQGYLSHLHLHINHIRELIDKQ